jgi:lysophospholipase L1-like esterase
MTGDLFWMPAIFLGGPVAIAWAFALYWAYRARKRADQGPLSRKAGASLMLVLLVIAGFLFLAIVPPWFRASVPSFVIRRIEIRLLSAVEMVYGVTILTASVALVPLLVTSVQRRKAKRTRIWTTRALALTLSLLMAGLAAEGVALAALWSNSIRMPWLPVRFEDRPGEKVVDILVVGESSASGVPYDKWFSVADIVAWKLQDAFPQFTFRIENQASPGLSLQAMHTLLRGIRRRPELVIIYAGHNEFQSRFNWAHGANHYADETPPTSETLQSLAHRVSPMMRLMAATADSLRLSTPPPYVVTRKVVDVPVYTAEEYAERRREFGIRLAAIVAYFEWIGAPVVLVIPPGNDAGFEPNRSFLSSKTPRAERDLFAREFLAARADETKNPALAEKAYRRLLDRQPQFAECHFRLARLLENGGVWDEAFQHYVAARDLDGLPMRMLSDFQQAYRDIAARHPRAILVDGPAEFHAKGDHGLIGDSFFTDGLHPSLNGYTILAQAILTRLHERNVFPWPSHAPAPTVTPLECAKRFEIDAKKWQAVCEYAEWFYNRTAYIRHDPAERLAKARKYAEAAQLLKAGKSVDTLAYPGVGPIAEAMEASPQPSH